jgi:hypothetical protein
MISIFRFACRQGAHGKKKRRDRGVSKVSALMPVNESRRLHGRTFGGPEWPTTPALVPRMSILAKRNCS